MTSSRFVSCSGNVKSYFQILNGLLEPSSVEKPQFDLFSYTPPAGETRHVLTSWATTLNGVGRLETRNPCKPMAFRGISLTGTQAGSMAIITNAGATTYDDPETEYYDRLAVLEALPLKFLGTTAPNVNYPFIPGPYGTIITRVCVFDLDWFACRNWGGPYGFCLANELGDAGAVDYVRFDQDLQLLMVKGTIGVILSGTEKSAGVGKGGVAYKLLPASWRQDPTQYVFRDDFMGACLDTSVWTVIQSSPGNIAVNTDFACVQGKGTGTWGTDGMYSTACYQRGNCESFVADGWIGSAASSTGFGLSDGLGVSYTNFLHGILIGHTGWAIWEAGAQKAGGGLDQQSVYRMRITPGVSGGALYELQGGRVNPMIGAPEWTTLLDTRATSAVSASSFRIGYAAYFAPAANGGSYLGDVKVTAP